jgi:type IV fimbrial biogenesis protein FimT
LRSTIDDATRRGASRRPDATASAPARAPPLGRSRPRLLDPDPAHQRSRLRSAAADLHQGASLASSEAIKRNIRTELRVVTTMWSVWDVTAVPPVMLRFGLFDPAVSAANLTLAFQSNGRTFPAGAVGTIGVTPTTMSCGADIRCPSVRITAGGSALICDPSKSTGTYGACS